MRAWPLFQILVLLLLGMPLAQAVEVLRRQCTAIKNVQVTYSERVSQSVYEHKLQKLVVSSGKLIFSPASSWNGHSPWSDKWRSQTSLWSKMPETKGLSYYTQQQYSTLASIIFLPVLTQPLFNHIANVLPLMDGDVQLSTSLIPRLTLVYQELESAWEWGKQ